MSKTIPLGVLLANLSAELDGILHSVSLVEDVVITGGPQAHADRDRDEVLRRLQHIDQITQVLRDLAAMASQSSRGPLAQITIERDRIRGYLQMTSLADRLLGAPQTASSGLELF